MVDTNDFPQHTVSCSVSLFSRTSRAAILGAYLAVLGALLTTPLHAGVSSVCYAVADGGTTAGDTDPDRLFSMDKSTGIAVNIGLTGTLDIEALAFNFLTDELMGTNGGQLGTIDISTGTFTASANPIGTCRLSGGATHVVADVDGLSFDPLTGIMWGSERGDGTNDILLQIDPTTGLLIPNTFGAGVDCVRIVEASGTFLLGDIDDLGIDPDDGTLYAVDNDGGTNNDQLITINKSNGEATLIGNIGINDMEGLAFGNDGTLFGTTGNNSGNTSDDNAMWTLDETTVAAPTKVNNFPATFLDFEAVACLTADVNLISGTVFYDVDGDGMLVGGSGDDGVGGITVRLYIDVNGDGLVDGGDTLIATTDSEVDGTYEFPIALEGDFVLEIDTGDLPAGSTMTTDNVEVASFVGFGNTDSGNDFGFRGPSELTVTKSSNAVGDVVPGQTITYTVTVTNNTSFEHTGIEVLDPLPTGSAYVSDSTSVTGPELADAFRVTEYFIDTSNFTTTSYDLTLDQSLAANYFVIVQGSDGVGGTGGTRGPDENYAALTGDPFGTGDLATSSGSDVITLTRNNGINDWVGVVTVVECLRNCTQNGFQLLDVQRVAHTGVTTSGTDTSGTAWSDIDQVMLLGGFNGAGCDTAETSPTNSKVCHTRIYPSGTDTINWTREASNVTLATATSTVMALEWGSAWTVQRVQVTGNYNGDGIDTVDEYNRVFLDTKVTRANTWVWGTGHTEQEGIGDAAEGAAITLGNGVNQFSSENLVTVGFERNPGNADFEVYALSHPNLATDYRFKADGDFAALTVDVTVDNASANRMSLVYNGHTGTGNAFPRPMLFARYLNDTTVRLQRRRIGTTAGNGNFPAWVQGIDFTNIRASSNSAVTKDNDALSIPAALVDGAPSDLVLPGDLFGLATGETLTVTYQITVDDPLNPNVTRILNTATIDSEQSLTPSSASVNDPVTLGGAIGDRVWLDVDGDGLQDIGEPGIANVELTLFDVGGDGMIGGGDDVMIAVTTTGVDGSYLFANLEAGTYYVDVTGATVPSGLGLAPGSTDPSTTRTITAEEIFLDVDFGYTNTGSDAIIGDTVWSDADSDGVLDPGEVGIDGVTVQLLSAGVDGILGTGDDVVEDTTTTGPDGSYLFTGVTPGDYIVNVDGTQGALTGYTFVAGPQSVSNPSVPISVEAGDIYLDADFAFNNPSTYAISDTVWLDTDSDGILDGSESGIAGVVVNLLDASGDVIATTTTDANGDFSFSGVPNGDYTLDIADTTGELIGLGGTTAPGQARSLAVNVAGADVTGTNFGYNGPGTIGDTVFSDADGDGLQDPGELGIDGVTVELWLDANGDGVFDSTVDTLVGSTVTAADGSYLFEGLLFGTYFASVDSSQAALTGYTATTTDEEVGANAAGVQIEALILSLDANFLDADFGYQNTSLPDVSGNVFNDLDADGLDDGVGEPGFAGVTLDLVDSGGNVIATTTTDANGDYTFPDVPSGSYTVEITDQDSILDGYQLTSGLDAIPITVVATDITDIDFGYVRESGTASIGDTVWLDADRDGIQEGAEEGLPGITVELYDPGPDGAVGGGDDILLATTVTDADGRYRFTGLDAGNYYVNVDETTLPSADLAATTANPSTLINLSEGQYYDQADFGYGTDPTEGAIGDFVWYDADGDGVQDPGEVGIGGVEIEVTGPGCSPCTTLTNADGSYLITGLAPGLYTVVFDASTLPAGYGPTATNADDWQVSLAAGDLVTSADFGFDGGTTGSIGDTVFLDIDGDGTQDPGDGGIEGVTVNLLDTLGNILATTTTDASGNYDFLGLPAGSYQVAVSDIDGVLDGLSLSTANNPTTTIVLAAGQDYDDADFGYEPVLGSIGNLVWHDQNGDGDVDTGEPGLSGVTVDLWLDNNGNGIIEPGTDNLLRQTTTNLLGEYQFTGLLPADYLVTVSDVHGVTSGFTLTSGTAGVDNNSQADPYAVTLTSGAPDDITADFGYFVNVSPLAISGTAFYDVAGNGAIDGADFGVEQVTVLLFRDLDGDGVPDPEDALINSLETDPSGDYLFTNLPPGDYIVAVDATGTFLSGGIQTTQLATSSVEPVTLVAVNSIDNDFGFNKKATVVLLTRFTAYEEDGQVVVEWQTAGEANSAGFYLYRYDAANEGFELVREEMIPALYGSPQGGSYRVVDAEASPYAKNRYLLVEAQMWGLEHFYGPYEVQVGPRPEPAEKAAMPLVDGYHAVPHQPSRSDLARLVAHRDLLLQQKARTTPAVDALKLIVRQDGIYMLSTDTLATWLGIDAKEARRLITTRRLSLQNQGSEIAWQALDRSRGILFYGEAPHSLFTLDNIYYLRLERGQRMRTIRGREQRPVTGLSFAESLHFEENLSPVTAAPLDEGADFWMWKGLIANHPTLGQQTFTLDLPDLAPGSSTASLSLSLQAVSDAQLSQEHHAVVRVNGTRIGETLWSGLSPHSATFAVDPTLLALGNNSVEITAVLDPGVPQSLFFVNGFDLGYQRFYRAVNEQLKARTDQNSIITVEGFTTSEALAFDISDPQQPSRLLSLGITGTAGAHQVTFQSPGQDATVFVVGANALLTPEIRADQPSDLRSSANRADYLIVTTGELRAAVEPLASYRASQGLTVMVVELENVMDEFNHGLYDPAALRDFFAHAADEWALAPRYALLAGAGDFDYRNNLGLGGNLIPPAMVPTAFGLFASDTWFVDTAGGAAPELAIGRLPVLTGGEVLAYLGKLQAYEAADPTGWADQALIVADNNDTGGNFTQDSNRLLSFLPPSMTFDRIYLDQAPLSSARQSLLTALSSGVGLVNYLGHGGLDRFADEGLLLTTDVPGLSNGERLPVVASMTCNVGRFEVMGFTSLGEALVLHETGGAIAVWAPSGLSLNFEARTLNETFLSELYAPGAGLLGDTLQAVFADYENRGRFEFMMRIYVLIGEPVLNVQQP